jgi:hypothetical protein
MEKSPGKLPGHERGLFCKFVKFIFFVPIINKHIKQYEHIKYGHNSFGNYRGAGKPTVYHKRSAQVVQGQAQHGELPFQNAVTKHINFTFKLKNR